MIFYTLEESKNWIDQHSLITPDSANPQNIVSYPKDGYRFYGFAGVIAQRFFCGDPVLLVIVEWGVWPSSENLHLYYKLRQSYLNFQLLTDAPGHLFLKHEKEDLTSFLQIAMLNGWDGYLVSQGCDSVVSFSHDEYVAVYNGNEKGITDLTAALKQQAT